MKSRVSLRFFVNVHSIYSLIYTLSLKIWLEYDYAMDRFSIARDELESVQYKACLAIGKVIRGSSRENLYRKLGKPLKLRSWENFVCFTKYYRVKISHTFLRWFSWDVHYISGKNVINLKIPKLNYNYNSLRLEIFIITIKLCLEFIWLRDTKIEVQLLNLNQFLI